MLIGLIPPSAGDATMCGNLTISQDMAAIRKQLGVCPQHDILFPELTAFQHLQMFASFKGVKSSDIDAEATRMLREVGLVEKANSKSCTLSGGQKRKLSVGIALIGNSKIVILDEPTSGMDPYSRRSTWNIIQRNKKGRIILLTTHFMDEADILGDRIAIMADGRLQCVGSTLFLKSAYGVGYTLTIVKDRKLLKNAKEEEAHQAHENAEIHTSIVNRAVVGRVAVAEPLSAVGAEQSFRLPFASAGALADLFFDLDVNKFNLGIAQYGISVTTLEEVFMKVGRISHHENDQTDKPANKNAMHEKASSIELKSPVVFDDQWVEETGMVAFIRHFQALIVKRAIYGKRDRRMFILQILLPIILIALGLGLLLIRPGLNQPDYTISSMDLNPTASPIHRNYVPFFVTKESDGESSSYAESMVEKFNLAEAGREFSSVQGTAVSITDQSYYSIASIKNSSDTAGSFYGCSQGADVLYNMSDFLLVTHDDRDKTEHGSARYGAITLSATTNATSLIYNVLINGSAIHGVGLYVNEVHQSFLQVLANSEDAKITVRNYPLPRTFQQNSESASANAFAASLFFMIACCFIPASFATFVVKEREVKAKHQQIISGVSLSAYWLSTFVWDCVSYSLTAALIIAVIFAYGIDSYTTGDAGAAAALLFILFGPSIAAFTYLISYAFSSHSTAQIMVMFINFLTGLCLMVVSFVLTNISTTSALNLQLRYLFRLFPSFCLGDGLLQLAICTKDSSYPGGVYCPGINADGYDLSVKQSPFAWDITGGSLVFMAWETALYFTAVLSIEYLLTFPSLLSWIYGCGLDEEEKKARLEENERSAKEAALEDEDEDVALERARVLAGRADGDVVKLSELRKVYEQTDVRLKGCFHHKLAPFVCDSSFQSGILRSLLTRVSNGCFKLFACGSQGYEAVPREEPKKKSSAKVAVQSLCFGIPRGECFGFLGDACMGERLDIS
jgi:ABC-type multidrug transport system ATPase subunit